MVFYYPLATFIFEGFSVALVLINRKLKKQEKRTIEMQDNIVLDNIVGNGTIFIKFYANDSVGNEAFKKIIIHKDIDKPDIIINDPTKNEIFELEAPEFNLTILEKFSHIWYTLDNGITNISCKLIDKINQILWDKLPNGFINVTFYANDTIGNISFITITIKKAIPV